MSHGTLYICCWIACTHARSPYFQLFEAFKSVRLLLHHICTSWLLIRPEGNRISRNVRPLIELQNMAKSVCSLRQCRHAEIVRHANHCYAQVWKCSSNCQNGFSHVCLPYNQQFVTSNNWLPWSYIPSCFSLTRIAMEINPQAQ